MKANRLIMAGITAAVLVSAVGCGSAKTGADSGTAQTVLVEKITKSTSAATAATSDTATAAASIPAGMYPSELTGEPIDESLKDQRPIAVMVDNEQTALPHFGTADADVVYEMMNSTMNGRITRLMCL